MMHAVLVKRGTLATLHITDPTSGGLDDYSRKLGPDDAVDGKAVWAFADGVYSVTEYPDEPPVQAVVPRAVLSNGSVVYEKDQVTAYFNDEDRAVPEAMATWKKVWRVKRGTVRLEIISLQEVSHG